MRIVVLIAALCLAFAYADPASAAHGAGSKTPGADKEAPKKGKVPPKPKEGERIGYSDEKIQLNGMMVPVRTNSGISYEVLTLRLVLAPGENARPACFMAPIVHEKMLLYLAGAKLERADFQGQRREVLAKQLFDVAVSATDRGFYTGVEFVDETSAPLENKSQTLSTQCR